MLKLTKGTSNIIRVSLGEIQEIALPTFLIAFENDASEAVVTCISADLSLYPERYNEFVIIEKSSPVALNGEVELEPVGFFTYRIYEQTSTTNLDESLADKLLDTGKARVVFNGDRKATAFVTYSATVGPDAFWDVFKSEGIVVTPPTTDATYENSDTSFTQIIAGGATFVAPDITWIDSDLTVNTAPANTDITCTPAASTGIIYDRSTPTAQRVTYQTNDDGWHFQNGTYTYEDKVGTLSSIDFSEVTLPGEVLSSDNAFGNTNRFTDEIGSQTYATGYVVDHLTGLGWKIAIHEDNITWADSITNAAALTFATFTDWRVPNYQELNGLLVFSRPNTLISSPFNISTLERLWTSTTISVTTTNAIVVFVIQGTSSAGQVKTSTANSYMVCRNHYT